MPKLYGPIISPNIQRPLLAAAEHSLEVELIAVDMQHGAHKQPDFLAKQPFGQVPAFEDGDVHLFESRAIAQYIDAKHGGSLLHISDPAKFGLVQTWISVENAHFLAPSGAIIVELVFKKFRGGETDHAVVAEKRKALEATLDVYEKHLSKNAYLAGDEYSMADLFHVPSGHALFDILLKDLLDHRPHVKAWWEKISQRPASKKVLAERDAAFAAFAAPK